MLPKNKEEFKEVHDNLDKYIQDIDASYWKDFPKLSVEEESFSKALAESIEWDKDNTNFPNLLKKFGALLWDDVPPAYNNNSSTAPNLDSHESKELGKAQVEDLPVSSEYDNLMNTSYPKVLLKRLEDFCGEEILNEINCKYVTPCSNNNVVQNLSESNHSKEITRPQTENSLFKSETDALENASYPKVLLKRLEDFSDEEIKYEMNFSKKKTVHNSIRNRNADQKFVRKHLKATNECESSSERVALCHVCKYKCKSKLMMDQHLLQHSNTQTRINSQNHLKTNSNENADANKTNSRYIAKINVESQRADDDCNESRKNYVKKGNYKQCPLCHFKTRYSLSNHLLTHSVNKPFKCPKCPYSTKRKDYLKEHILIHSEKKMYKCSKCEYSCKQRTCLNTHMAVHSGFKLFKCDLCQFQSNHRSTMKTHSLKHLGLKQFKCFYCDYESYEKRLLNVHLLIHNSIKKFKCSTCDYRTNYAQHLKNHEKDHTGKRHECKMCPFTTNNEHKLKRHKICHSEQFLKCSICNFQTKYSTTFESHMLDHTDIKIYHCSKCGKGFNNKVVFSVHMRTHMPEEEKHLSCSQCDFKTYANHILENHKLRHLAKSIKCPKCRYKTNMMENLKKHLSNMHKADNMQNDEKKFSCSECSYTTQYKCSIKNHLWKHMDSKKYSCDKCSFKNNDRKHFRRHVLSHFS